MWNDIKETHQEVADKVYQISCLTVQNILYTFVTKISNFINIKIFRFEFDLYWSGEELSSKLCQNF